MVDIGICPTPTVQYMVKTLGAQGGIAISASHNPNEWNALKLLNSTGRFMTPEENTELLKILKLSENRFKKWDKIGKTTFYSEGIKKHMDDVLKMNYINKEEIKKEDLKF